MEVSTDTEEVRSLRRITLELLCANHRMDCTWCPRGMDCELRDLLQECGVDDKRYGEGSREGALVTIGPLTLDNTRCVLCRRCISVCEPGAIFLKERGFTTSISVDAAKCDGCGKCIEACLTGAMLPRDDTRKVWKALFHHKQPVIAFLAHSLDPKLPAILRRIGFDKVYPLVKEAPEGFVVRVDTNLAGKIKGEMSLTPREAMAMFRRCCVSTFTQRQVLERLGEEPLDEV